MDLVLRLVVRAAHAELASERLWSAGATAVEEQPAAGGEIALMAGFPTADAVVAAAASIPGAQVVEIDDDSWRDAWRLHAEPVDAGRKMRVVPSWRETTLNRGRIPIAIDPGHCFGSGSHPTTRMLLGLLERFVVGTAGTSVLDVGTGSGILAVAAARLGAARVVAIDIEPDSVPVTTANAAANGVADQVTVSTIPLAAVAERFDVVVANLSAGTIAELAEGLRAATKEDGVLLLSGLLPGQWQHVEPGFGSPTEIVELEGWVAVVCHRGDPRPDQRGQPD